MSKGFWVVLLALIVTGCAAPGKAPDIQPEMQGFRGLSWGISIETVQEDLILKGEDSLRGVKWYERKDESMTLGTAKIASIDYVFCDGIFTAVTIIGQGHENCRNLKECLEQRLGKSKRSGSVSDFWDLGGCVLLFSYGQEGETCPLVLRAKE
jgi:hypothetical protein